VPVQISRLLDAHQYYWALPHAFQRASPLADEGTTIWSGAMCATKNCQYGLSAKHLVNMPLVEAEDTVGILRMTEGGTFAASFKRLVCVRSKWARSILRINWQALFTSGMASEQ